jgi:hypothetical protein
MVDYVFGNSLKVDHAKIFEFCHASFLSIPEVFNASFLLKLVPFASPARSSQPRALLSEGAIL